MEMTIRGNQNTTKLANQLKSSAKQYPCLNKDEERELIEKYRNDRDTLNKLLFMHNIRIVFNLTKKYASKVNDFDSLLQDGMLGLAEAARRFDIDRNIKFCTYCVAWVRKYILAHFYGRQVELDRVTTSLNSPSLTTKSSDSANSTFENYVNEYIDPTYSHEKTIESEISSNEQIQICKKLYDELERDSSLSVTDRAVFTDMFFNKEKTRDIADKYSLEIEDVAEIKVRLLGKCKTILHDQFHINSLADVI